ncbi:MAG TPA: DUF3000 domain-containing protein [Jatrophihabitans sp.]|jgi:hypothetical protein|nr:DUF3000 domain-containing protein [Jatrophihabitans sp.]
MLPDSGFPADGEPAAESSVDADAVPSTAPEPFRTAISTLLATTVRPQARVERIRPPQRLAPWAFAVAVDILPGGASSATAHDSATGRLVVLYDPDGSEAWDGEIRLVGYAQADLAADMAGDPLLPAVGWSWLTEALQQRGGDYTAVGGTVTQTTSTRFGDVHGPSSTTQLELRGSWTATSTDLSPHLLAFVDLLCAAAGLPPEGVAVLGDR